MNFLDDLIEQDETLAGADASVDPTVKAIIESAAKSGNVSALKNAIDRGQVNQNTSFEIVVNVTEMAGKWQGEFSEKELAKRLEFVGTWVAATTPSDPGPRQERLNTLLQACYVSEDPDRRLRMSDSVAKILVEYGADPLAKSSLPLNGPMAGARFGLTQTNMTLIAHAMYNGSDATSSFLLNHKASMPFVATVERDGISHDLTAAGYALALGDIKQMRAVLSSVDKSSDTVRVQMTEAIQSARELHLTDFGPDEVHHGIAALLAAGAKIPSKDAAQSIADTPVIIIGSPSMKFFNKSGEIIDGETPIQDDQILQRVGFAASMLNAKNPKDVKGALEALFNAGWDVNSVANQPINGMAGQATIAHYAASRGDIEILSALRKLGADFQALDAQGRNPATYAEHGLNPQSAKFIDPLHVFKTAVAQPKPEPVLQTPSDAHLDEINSLLSEASAYDRDHEALTDFDAPEEFKQPDKPVTGVAASFKKLKGREPSNRVEANAKAVQSSPVAPIVDLFGGVVPNPGIEKAEKAQAAIESASKPPAPRTLFSRRR